jgi:hypothetical protein
VAGEAAAEGGVMEKWREEKRELVDLWRQSYRLAYQARKIGNKEIVAKAERLASSISDNIRSKHFPWDIRGFFAGFVNTAKKNRKQAIKELEKARKGNG